MRGAKAKRLRRERPDRPNPGRVLGGAGPQPRHITMTEHKQGRLGAFLQELFEAKKAKDG